MSVNLGPGRSAGTATVPRRGRWPVPELWPHLVRMVWWQPILAAGVVAGLVVRLATADPFIERSMGALLLALGAAMVLDDPAAATLNASPTSLGRRRRLRLALALPLVGVDWVVVGWAANQPNAELLPPGSATLVLATFVAIVLASTALAGQDDGMGGAAAGPALLAFVVVAIRLPERWALLPVEGHERRWGLVLAAAVLVLLASSRDPAARRRLTRRAGG